MQNIVKKSGRFAGRVRAEGVANAAEAMAMKAGKTRGAGKEGLVWNDDRIVGEHRDILLHAFPSNYSVIIKQNLDFFPVLFP